MSKILIVEDEDAIRRVLKKVLSEENSKFIIDEAIDGVDAEKKIKLNSKKNNRKGICKTCKNCSWSKYLK